MDLAVQVSAIGQDDQSWLGSSFGTSSAESITLNVAAFTAATHYPNGYFPSGLPLGRITTVGATLGMLAPYTAASTDGTQNLAGFLLTPVIAPKVAGTNVAGALLDHGRVIVAKLPVTVTAAAQATNTHFIYV